MWPVTTIELPATTCWSLHIPLPFQPAAAGLYLPVSGSGTLQQGSNSHTSGSNSSPVLKFISWLWDQSPQRDLCVFSTARVIWFFFPNCQPPRWMRDRKSGDKLSPPWSGVRGRGLQRLEEETKSRDQEDDWHWQQKVRHTSASSLCCQIVGRGSWAKNG